MHQHEDIDAAEQPFVGLLCGFFVEWAAMLGAPAWVRDAIIASLQDGWLRGKLLQALREARVRGQHDMSHPTPVVHDQEYSSEYSTPVSDARPTLPTVPPGVDEREVPTAKVRSITRQGGFKVED